MNMMLRRPKLLIADLLCGAGGSSTGCAQALAGARPRHGIGVRQPLADRDRNAFTSTIRAPGTICQDIATVRPHLIVPEGYLDILMASPSCTHHSVARGGKPTSDQQRSDPWHIITWLTELDVAQIIIENVWEFVKWGPVDPATGRPIKARAGEYFKAWIAVLQSLGYAVEWRKLNAADYGEATTRQRFILMGRKDGQPIDWPAVTHGKAVGRAMAAGARHHRLEHQGPLDLQSPGAARA
jgi:DNA (cytosine-5)-methyltransferase 1